MADEETKVGRSAPGFVHSTREPRNFTGPANPVALWAEARANLGDGAEITQDQVLQEYRRLCEVATIGDAVVLTDTYPGLTQEVVLSEVGRAALGSADDEPDTSEEVA